MTKNTNNSAPSPQSSVLSPHTSDLTPHSPIYVAGHKGLVGSAITRKLQEKGYKNLILKTSKELDLRNQLAVEEFFRKEKPEYIFLAAAKVGGILANNTYKAEFIYDNIMIAANIIHSAYEYGAKKLLNLGSSCIYPKYAPQPMKEEHLLTGTLEQTNEPYAIAKISAIKLVRYYNEQYGTNFLSVMPTNLYGPGDNFNLFTSHVLPALIRKMHLAKCLQNDDWEGIKKDLDKNPIEGVTGNSPQEDILKILNKYGIREKRQGVREVVLTVWGSGKVYREFMYVDDLAEACIFLMENVDASDMVKISPDYFVNAGTGNDLTINELTLLIKRIVGFNGDIEHDLTKPDGTPRKLLDVSKLFELGWRPKVSLEEGIRRTYEWYIK